MTASIYLVYKQYAQLGQTLVNGVVAVLINSDSSANAVKNAVKACNAVFTVTEGQSEANNTPQDAFSPLYFTTTNSNDVVVLTGTPPGSGNLSADGDAYVFPGPATAPKFVLGTAYTVTD